MAPAAHLRLVLAGLVLLLTGMLGACGGDPDSAPAPADPPESPGPLSAFAQRCFSQNLLLEDATLRYDSPVGLQESESERFTVSLTAEEGESPSGEVQGRLKVACVVEARLVTDPDEMHVSDTGWVSQRYAPPTPARWTWVVTGEAAGESDAVVELKPVVRVTDADGKLTEEDLVTEPFDVTFDVARSPTGWLGAWWKVLVGAAAGVGTIAGAVVAVRKLARSDET